MGMDSYLYKTTKEAHSAYLDRSAKYAEINKDFLAFCDGLEKKVWERFVS